VDAAAAAAVRAAGPGAGVGAVAKSAVQGAISGAKVLGVDPADTGCAAACGAMRAAGALGASALGEVRRDATGTIDGVEVSLSLEGLHGRSPSASR
jgi:hypothetical protein